MKPYAQTVGFGLLLVAGFNYSIDPARQWRPLSYAAMPSDWPPGRIWTMPGDFDDREFKLARLRHVAAPDVVIFGSSRGMLTDSKAFAPDVSVYNASMTGASVEDHAAVWQALKDLKKTPPLLLLYADPWLFNENSGQIRWRRNIALYEKFLWTASGNDPLPLWKEALRQRWRIFYDGLCELLSWKVLSASTREITRPKAVFSRSTPPEFVLEDSGLGGWRADGSRVGPAEEIRVKSLAAIRAVAIEYAGMKDVYSLDRYQIDWKALKVLDVLADDMKAHGTKLLIVTPPYHQQVIERLARRPEYSEVLGRFSSLLNEASRQGTKFPVCSAIDPGSSGCGEQEFVDGMHMHPSCNLKVLRRCLALSPDWKAAAAPVK